MTRSITARIVANWPLIVILATILGVGWGARTAISNDIETRVEASRSRLVQRVIESETRIDKRIDREITAIGENIKELKSDLRAIRQVLSPITPPIRKGASR